MRFALKSKAVLGITTIIIGIIISLILIAGTENENNKSAGKGATTFENSQSSMAFFQFESKTGNNYAKTAFPKQQVQEECNSTEKCAARPEGKDAANDNLTDQLVQVFMSNIATQQETINTEEGIGKLVESMIKPIETDSFEMQDILLSYDNSIENKIYYLKELRELNEEYFSDFENENTQTALNHLFENDDASVLQNINNVIPEYIDALLETEVPTDFAELHLQLLNIWEKKRLLYETIIDYKEDYMKAVVALQELTSVVNNDIKLQKSINTVYETLTTQ